MAFSPQFLDEIRARLAVSEVVGRKVKLARRGREFVGLSPFNKEKTPSFTVNDEKGFYHCFSSGEHGDIFTFLMQTEGLSFPETVEQLAARAGLEMPRSTPQEAAREKARASLYDVVEKAADWYANELTKPSGRAALDYLRSRGLDDGIIQRFRLGFAPDGRGRLVQALEAAGIGRDRIVAAGLAKDSGTQGSLRDYFFGRIIFPITDRRGQVLAFGGRTLGDGQPKYLNSPETPLFRKGSVLYGLSHARDAIRDTGTVIVAEGYMDVIALAQAGIAYAVAPLGTALTEAQIAALWRVADEPILCFDGDAAGVRAAGRAATRALAMLEPGKSLRFARLPPGEDPDSLIAARGVEAFERVLGAARNLVDVIWDAEVGTGKLDTPERRAALKRDLGNRVAEIADRSVAEFYRIAFDERLDALFPRTGRQRGDYRRGKRSGPASGLLFGPARNYRRNQGAGGRASRDLPGHGAPHGNFDNFAETQERILLALMINHPACISSNIETLTQVHLSSARLDRVLREIINLTGSEPDLDTGGLKRHLMKMGFTDLEKSVLTHAVYSIASFASPEAGEEEAMVALGEILEWHGRREVEIDQRDAERLLANDMNEANLDRLSSLNRERLREN